MQFNILSYPIIINHLKQISKNMYRKLNNEIMIHCPFCDDSTRAKASNHGHLYLSIQSPVFNCFRCNTSGTLISFLIQTGFDDQETLSLLSQFIKINFTKDYYKLRDHKDLPPNQLKNKIINLNLKFKKENPNLYNRFQNYIFSRIGEVDYTEFLLFPSVYDNNLIINFNNSIGDNVLIRYVDNTKIRYQINKNITSNLYYFQNMNNKSIITLCEGPFKIINLYLYNDLFKNSFFISINGKNYINVIERLIITDLLIGNYHINLVFDNDFLKKSKNILHSVFKLSQIYNGEISFSGFKPLDCFNDVDEFNSVETIL